MYLHHSCSLNDNINSSNNNNDSHLICDQVTKYEVTEAELTTMQLVGGGPILSGDDELDESGG